jgi:hypothetical protein
MTFVDYHCRAILRLMSVGALMMCLLCHAGCTHETQPRAASTSPTLPQTPSGADVRSLRDLLATWEKLHSDQLIQSAIDLTAQIGDDSHLRAFTFSEHEFLSLSEPERHAQQREHINTGQSLLEVSRRLIELAQSLEAEGRLDEAAMLCDSVAAFGKANNVRSLSRLAQSYGQAILTVVERDCPIDHNDN